MTRLAQDLKTTPAQLGERIAKLQESLKKMEKEKSLGVKTGFDIPKMIEEAETVGPYRLVAFHERGLDVSDLRHLSDAFRTRDRKIIYLLVAEHEDKIHFLLGMSHDLQKTNLDLRELMRQLSPLLKAVGGGRKDFVQGGGRNQGQLQTHWNEMIEQAKSYLKESG
jgi:alanyl-tRNA synthetase